MANGSGQGRKEDVEYEQPPTWPWPPARRRTNGRHARSLVRQLADEFGPFTEDGAALMEACPELYGPS